VTPTMGSERNDRVAALATLGLGLLVAVSAQLAAPFPGPPLYDGVVPLEAYRWLTPPPGQHGGAEGASTTVPVVGNRNPLVTIATPELTPQAQLFAAPGGLILPPGTTSLSVSITPIPAAAQPSEGHIAGNVYRISVTTQAGTPVTALASADVSVVLRSPDETMTEASVGRLQDGSWQPQPTDPVGLGASFVAIVTQFGDMAVLAPGPAPTYTEGPGGSPTIEPPTAPPPVETAAPTPSAAPGSGSGIPTVTIVAVAALVAVMALLLFGAMRPRRRPPSSWGSDRDRRRRR
jgi:hypothetical protein